MELDAQDFAAVGDVLKTLDRMALNEGVVFSGDVVFSGIGLTALIDYDPNRKCHNVKKIETE